MNELATGTVVDGRYEIVERLGSGGMADVYCAVDQQLGRRVALKVLYRRFAADGEFVERFRREASSAAGLQHQHVVSVYDRGEWDGTYYIAMEYLEGRSLKELVQQEGPLQPDAAIDLAIQILRAARFAHRRGIIHRDFKPHNVIVDDEWRAKVTDFGIARAGASDMTQTGSIMGTAQYLSPEQAQGHAVSQQSDLYSIGIVLYEMLTGRVPFDGESAVAIALKQVSEPPVPPSRLNPAVSTQLEAVVLRALAKAPEERFADADEFIAALEAARGTIGQQTAAIPAPFPAPATVYDGVYAPEPARPPSGPVSVVDAPEPARPPGGSASRWWWALLAGLLVAAAVVAAVLLLGAGKQVSVPKVVGAQVSAANAAMRNRGLDVSITRVNDRAARGIVIRQDPLADVRVDEGSRVALTVSDGPGTKPVPDVEGHGRHAAARELAAAGFKSKERVVLDDTVAQDHVIRTNPSPTTPLDIGSTVTLIVSGGKQKVDVPGVVGKKLDEARVALTDLGLKVDVAEKESADQDPGTVLAQNVPPGTKRSVGATVRLTVAKAPTKVDVPDVTGQSDIDAVTALTQAGFTPAATEQDVPSADQDGIVLSQSPAGGGKAKKGSKVEIVVGRYRPATTPTTTTPTTPTTTPTTTTP